MSNFEIKQQFVVDGQAFDTVEAAEAYIASNATRVRVVAFIDHLKANGAKRISKAVTDAVEQFIAFEEGTGNDASDTPTEKETSGASEEVVDTAEVDEPGKNVETPKETAPAGGAEKTSKHVAGPDEDLEEDPLAGLDLESLED